MSLCCSLHLVAPRHCREVLLPTLLGDPDATCALTRWVQAVAPDNPTPAGEVVRALQEQWVEALQHGIDADDFLAAGVFWNYGLLCGCALPVHAVQGFSLSFLEEAGLRQVARLGVRPQGILFTDRAGAPLAGAPSWISTESHASFVADEMAGGVVPAGLVPQMLDELTADLPGHARRLAQSGRDPRRCLEALLGALRLAKRSGLAVLELTGAVAGLRCLLPRENVRADGYLPVDVKVQLEVADAIRSAGLAAPAPDAVLEASAAVQGALADALRLDTEEPTFRHALTEVDRPAYTGEPEEVAPARTEADRPVYVEALGAAETMVAELAVAELAVTEPVDAEPEDAEPVDAEPAMAEPAVAEPMVAEPVVAEPVVAEQNAAGPAAEESAAWLGISADPRCERPLTPTLSSEDRGEGAKMAAPPNPVPGRPGRGGQDGSARGPRQSVAACAVGGDASPPSAVTELTADELTAKESPVATATTSQATLAAPPEDAAPPEPAEAPAAPPTPLLGVPPEAPAAVPASAEATAPSSPASAASTVDLETPSPASAASTVDLETPPPASTGATVDLETPPPASAGASPVMPAGATGTQIRPAFSGFVADRPKKKAVLQTRIIEFQAADLSHLQFGLPPLKPGDTATPNEFRIRARVIPATGAAEARLRAPDGSKIRSFRGTPPADLHSPESAEGFWARVSISLADLARRVEADAHEAGVWLERVDLSLDAEARRDESGLHLEDAKLQLRAHGWPWVLRERSALLPKLLSRAVYLWLADSPARGRVRLRRPQLTALDPRQADPQLVRTRPEKPLGQRLSGLVELGPRAVSALLKQGTSRSNTWRTEATIALIAIRDRRALRTLGDLAGSRGPVCPPFAVKIGRHELRSAGPPHDDYTLRDLASWGLGLWSHQDRIGTTQRIRRDTAFWKRFVGEHGEETDDAWRLLAIERASDMLCSGDVLERVAAAERLGDPDLAGREAARALEVVLSTKEPEPVLRAAVEAAMRCRSKSLVPSLLTLLDDPRLPPGATVLSGRRPIGVRDLAARAILRAHRLPLPEIDGSPDPTDDARLAYPDEALHAVVMQARKLAAV